MSRQGCVMVTGATGMLGQKVLAEVRRRGLTGLGLARKGSDINLDLTNDETLARAFEPHRPGLVINCAAMADVGQCEDDPDGAYRINARAVAVLAGLCRSQGARLVQISTEHYFTGDGAARHDEMSPVNLLHDYARSKFAGEAFTLTNVDGLVLRVNIIGLRGWPKPTFAEWALQMIDDDGEATLFDDSFVSSIDTAACARSILDLVEKKATGIINLGSREVFSRKSLIESLAAARGKKLTRAKTGSVKSLDLVRAESLGMDVSRAEEILDYELPTLAQVTAAVAAEYEARR